jgi:hypothetical protein
MHHSCNPGAYCIYRSDICFSFILNVVSARIVFVVASSYCFYSYKTGDCVVWGYNTALWGINSTLICIRWIWFFLLTCVLFKLFDSTSFHIRKKHLQLVYPFLKIKLNVVRVDAAAKAELDKLKRDAAARG